MNNIRVKKARKVEQLRQVATTSAIMIVLHNKGVSVAQVNQLRKAIREANAHYIVTKNTLARLAFKDTDFSEALHMLKGPVSLAYAKDPVAVSKVIRTFCKGNEALQISGAVMGDKLLPPSEVHMLADLPSLDVLRSNIVGLLNAPASKIVRVIQAPATKIARVFDAYANAQK